MSPIHKLVIDLVIDESSKSDWLDELNIAQLSLLLMNICILVGESSLLYASFLDNFLPYLSERL